MSINNSDSRVLDNSYGSGIEVLNKNVAVFFVKIIYFMYIFYWEQYH